MPITRRQVAISEDIFDQEAQVTGTNVPRGKSQHQKKKKVESSTRQSKKRNVQQAAEAEILVQPPMKKSRTTVKSEKQDVYHSGTIERGHIFFFYHPRAEVEEVHSVNEIKNFHMLLVPRPPEFVPRGDVKVEMGKAVPVSDTGNITATNYRLITVGKKLLPNPEHSDTQETGKKETFWAIVTAVGDDSRELASALQAKYYQTKTRGTRQEGPTRLLARGGYAIVNTEAKKPSQRATHLGYQVSHPQKHQLGDVQASLGVISASSFALQVKNPLAPAINPQQPHSKQAKYPDWIMRDVFGQSDSAAKRRHPDGLKFVSCGTPELLDYNGAQLILIATREGEEGLAASLGEGKGNALSEKEEEEETKKMLDEVFEEIGLSLKC